MTSPMDLAVQERTDLADLLDTLTADQWVSPTLCGDWNVRELVTHIISYEELSFPQLIVTFSRGGFLPNRVNRQRREALAGYDTDRLRTTLRAHLRPQGLTTAFGGAIGLTDSLIHHQDIRRPLGLPRTIPAERLRVAFTMGFRAPVLPVRRNARGLSLKATDMDWARGSGPEVTGPGEALLLALAGRGPAIDDLDGDGLAILADRVRRPTERRT